MIMDYNKIQSKPGYKNKEQDLKVEGLGLPIDQQVESITDMAVVGVISPVVEYLDEPSLSEIKVAGRTMKVKPAMLNLRESPNGKVKTILYKKAKVEVESSDIDGWVKVSSTHGVSGYVLEQFLEE
jgi:uncharacterized protein YgiM (DUF1202 family)